MNGMRLRLATFSVLVGVAAMVAPGLARAAVITEYTSGVTTPGAMVNGADGNVWFINGNGIAKIDASGHVTTYTAGLDAGATPYDLTNGPNSDLWFTDNGAKAVGYITTSGAIHEFSTPAGENPLQVVAGSDGNIWFYSSGVSHQIVRMTPSGSFTGYTMPTLGTIEDNMVLGPDGAIWFSDAGTTSIGKIAPTGAITEYPLTGGAFPTNITVGPDGNLWFSDNSGAVGRITTSGSVHEYTTGLQTGADPDAITAGPDGNVWFTDQYANRRAIGRVTPAGQITEFTSGLNSDLPLDITAGADGNLWIPQASMGSTTPSAVAQITPSGQITEITKGVNPDGLQDGDSILAGTAGGLWFTDNESPKSIGQIVLAPVASTGPTTTVASTSATVSGSITPLAATTAVSIQYGTSPALGSSTAAGSLPAGTAKKTVTGSLAALPPDTTIYYRVVATNSAGESDGATVSFKTSSSPPPPPPADQQTSATFGNQLITLTTPPSSICTARSSRLPVTLKSLTLRNSKKAKLRLSRAAFYLDRGIKHTANRTVRRHGKKVTLKVVTYRANATVKRLPASPKLKLSGLKSGRHMLKATVSYTEPVNRHGHKSIKAVSRTLTAKFAVC
jgi:streptogramin lyase